MNVLFISEQRLKATTAIHGNVDPQDLLPAVQSAQDTYVQQLLGATFYNGLKNRVSTNTESADERLLLDDYIGPMLAYYALYVGMPTLTYKIFNKSVSQATSEESVPATLEQVQYVRDSVMNQAEFYRERALEYLKNNQILFPEYLNPDTQDGMLPKKTSDFYAGIVIPGGYGSCTGFNEWEDNDASN